MKFAFPARFRIRRGSEFARVREIGTQLYSKNFLLVVAPSPYPYSRLGIIVTRKVDPRAVIRNRIKRQLREIFRIHRLKLKGELDLVIIARRDAAKCKYAEIKKQVLGSLSNKGYLKVDHAK